MPFRSSDLLQFDELKELLAAYAGSAAGKQRLIDCDVYREQYLAEADLADTQEAINYLQSAAAPQKAGHGAAVRFRFDQIRDVSVSLPLLRVEGSRLEGAEILDLFHTLSLAGEYHALLAAVSDRFPRLARRGRELADLRPVVRRYQRAFQPDGSLADDASPELRRIRRDIDRQQKSIQE